MNTIGEILHYIGRKLNHFSFIVFLLLFNNFIFSQNLVTNGSFETWPITPDWPTIGPGIGVAQEVTTVFDGASSASVIVFTTDQTQTDFRQTINVTAGVSYDVSVRINQLDNQANARLFIEAFTGIYSDENIVGAWQELTYTFVAGVSGPIEIGLRFYDVAANWIGGPSVILVDRFFIEPTPGIIPNQFEFQYGAPANAGVGLPFSVTVCATDGNSLATAYTNPILLNDLGSTAAYSINPASPITPANGCVTYTITPTSTGTITLDFGNADFPNIPTGIITVENLAIPSVAYSTEIYDTDPLPELHADTLNDSWEAAQGDSCVNIAGGIFTTTYGGLTYDVSSHTGTVTGLEVMTGGTTGVPYGGTVTYQLVYMNGPSKGTHFTTADGSLSADPFTMQASSPKPSAISADFHYGENTGNLSARNGIHFNFSVPVTDFGCWIGDVETNPFGTNAEMFLFYNDALLNTVPIVTSSSLAEQMNTGGTGCGSSALYPGCGNHATRWVSFSGAPVTDMVLVVGDDEVGGAGLTEHMSFGGVTLGGNCNVVVLDGYNWELAGVAQTSGIHLNWQNPADEAVVFDVERRNAAGKYETLISKLEENLWIDKYPLPGLNVYRLRITDETGNTVYSSPISMIWKSIHEFRIFPNPATDLLVIENPYSSGKFAILNSQGQSIREINLKEKTIRLDLSDLPKGIYFCRWISPFERKAIRLQVE